MNIQRDKNSINHNSKGLHFAIPVFLLSAGVILILIAVFTIAKPFFSLTNLFLSKQPSASGSSYSASAPSAVSGKIVYSKFGQIMGHLTVPSAGIDYDVYHGDHNEQLKKGIGHFIASHYPGEGGKIVLDGHRETVFRNMRKIKIGDLINFKTAYGSYVYKVNDIKIVKATDAAVISPDDKKEYLVMYTCYPFDTIGYKPERYVVYANLLSGTKVQIPN